MVGVMTIDDTFLYEKICKFTIKMHVNNNTEDSAVMLVVMMLMMMAMMMI